MLTEKANAICLLEVLREYSDAEHILPMREIISKMQTIYGLKPDRRTVYSAAAMLNNMGCDISMYEENGVGYFLRGRELEQSEVLLLTHAVYAFPFIPAGQSEQLIERLQKQLSIHQRKRYRHLTVVRQERKTDNRQVFWNIEQLDEAISQKKKVRFTYLRYGMDKKQHAVRKRVTSPYEMLYTNEHFYLICCLDYSPGAGIYRIDRMKDIEILDKPRRESAEIQSETMNAVYAFGGTPEHIVLRCDREILDDMIDRFGTEAQIIAEGEDKFTVSFTAPPRGIQFLAQQYLEYIEVLEPQWLREQVIHAIQHNPYTQ